MINDVWHRFYQRAQLPDGHIRARDGLSYPDLNIRLSIYVEDVLVFLFPPS